MFVVFFLYKQVQITSCMLPALFHLNLISCRHQQDRQDMMQSMLVLYDDLIHKVEVQNGT